MAFYPGCCNIYWNCCPARWFPPVTRWKGPRRVTNDRFLSLTVAIFVVFTNSAIPNWDTTFKIRTQSANHYLLLTHLSSAKTDSKCKLEMLSKDWFLLARPDGVQSEMERIPTFLYRGSTFANQQKLRVSSSILIGVEGFQHLVHLKRSNSKPVNNQTSSFGGHVDIHHRPQIRIPSSEAILISARIALSLQFVQVIPL